MDVIERELKRYAARQYVEHGFNVMPLRQGTKRPLLREWKVRQDVALTRLELDRLFARNDCEIAILAGQTRERIANVLIIDVDDPQLFDTVMGMQETPMFHTTNRGLQFYYRLPLDEFLPNSVKVGGLAIDVRSQGAYGIPPPSMIDGYRRQWQHGIVRAADLPLFPAEKLMISSAGNNKAGNGATSMSGSKTDGPGNGTSEIGHIRAYIRAIPSVMGQNGSKGLMRVCYVLCDHFDDFNSALAELIAWNEVIPVPPWDVEKELVRALTNAFKRKGKG